MWEINSLLYVLKGSFNRTTHSLLLYYFWLFFIYWPTVKPIQVIIIILIIYLSSIALWSFIFIDIKYPPSSLFRISFVDFWFVCIIFIGSAFINPENFHRVWWKIVSGMYTNHIYIFTPPTGLRKVVERVKVFVISSVAINTLIGFKAVPQVIQVWSSICKCCPKGYKSPLG